jgi:hypothetical protein
MVITIVRLLNFFLTPLGKCIDKTTSGSYYYSRSAKHDDIVYSRNGNWFEIGAKSFKADVPTFKPLAEDIGKDKDFIYYAHKPQPHVNYHSFTVSSNVLQDKNHTYTRTTDYYTYLLEADQAK